MARLIVDAVSVSETNQNPVVGYSKSLEESSWVFVRTPTVRTLNLSKKACESCVAAPGEINRRLPSFIVEDNGKTVPGILCRPNGKHRNCLRKIK